MWDDSSNNGVREGHTTVYQTNSTRNSTRVSSSITSRLACSSRDRSDFSHIHQCFLDPKLQSNIETFCQAHVSQSHNSRPSPICTSQQRISAFCAGEHPTSGLPEAYRVRQGYMMSHKSRPHWSPGIPVRTSPVAFIAPEILQATNIDHALRSLATRKPADSNYHVALASLPESPPP